VLTATPFQPNFGLLPLEQIANVGGRALIFKVFQPTWSRCLNVTDGRTDRQTTHCGLTALCVSLRV